MKKNFASKNSSRSFYRRGSLVLGCCLAGMPAFAEDAKPAAPSPAKEDKEEAKSEKEGEGEDSRNWLTMSVGGLLSSGNHAEFQRQYQMPRNAFGGIEDFHYEQDVGKKGIFKIDGRGIYDNRDYSVRLELSNPDVGYVRGGFEQYRTWYNGSGGYYPPSGWIEPDAGYEMAVDRGELFFQAGLTMPKKPQVSVEYRHQFREGTKDSTIWGETAFPGLPAGGEQNLRSIVPSFYTIDEARDIFAVDVQHRFGKTEAGVGASYDTSTVDNSLNSHRRPDLPATSGTASFPYNRYSTTRDGQDNDAVNAHTFLSTKLHEKVTLSGGYAFTTLDTDLSGSRIYGSDYEQLYDPTFRESSRYAGYTNLFGGSQMNQHLVNLNLMAKPWKSLSIVPSVRVEKNDLSSESSFVNTPLAGSGDEGSAISDRGFVDLSEALDVRYSGITNWVLYARGYWLQGQGDYQERSTGLNDLNRDTDFDRTTQKYTAGANWYPMRKLNFGLQYYHKIRDNEFTHNADSTPNTSGDRYPAYLTAQDFTTDDVNFRVTWRPVPKVTTVTRYDYQLSTIDSQADRLASVQSSERQAHIFGESITWSPLARWYMQGNFNYVVDGTETPTDAALGLSRVQKAENDYWDLSFLTGYALDDKTDLQLQYTYYQANNFTDNYAVGLPLGAEAQEQGVTVGFARRLRKNILWNVKYGYFRNEETTAGEHLNYEAHLVYTSWQYRF